MDKTSDYSLSRDVNGRYTNRVHLIYNDRQFYTEKKGQKHSLDTHFTVSWLQWIQK